MCEAEALVYAGPCETGRVLQRMVGDAGWKVQQSSDWRQALEIAARSHASVLIYDMDGNTGQWSNALEEVQKLDNGPAFVMASRLADDCMWAELLAHSGFDLLLKPFDYDEVRWTVFSAHRDWARRQGKATAERRIMDSARARERSLTVAAS